MVKVRVVFTEGDSIEFYAYENGTECNNGRAVYWKSGDGKVVTTYSLSEIRFFREEDLDE